MIRIIENKIIFDNAAVTFEDKAELDLQLAAILNAGYTEIFIDLGMTNFLPSEVLGFLMWKKSTLRKTGIVLKITRISDTLKSLFDCDSISNYFEINDAEVISYPYN